MNPLALLNPARWALYIALAASVLGGYMYWQHHEREIGAAPYIAATRQVNADLKAQKAEAAKVLAAETAKPTQPCASSTLQSNPRGER